MRAELKNCEVLAMYDVRGIQAYIFKSNVAKEIVGASELVRQIITEGLDAYIKTLPCEKSKNYLTEWKDDDPEAELNDLYAECNGDQCYNQVKRGTITNEILEVEVSDSLITIDITDIKLDKRTMTYIKEIFGDLLDIKLTK